MATSFTNTPVKKLDGFHGRSSHRTHRTWPVLRVFIGLPVNAETETSQGRAPCQTPRTHLRLGTDLQQLARGLGKFLPWQSLALMCSRFWQNTRRAAPLAGADGNKRAPRSCCTRRQAKGYRTESKNVHLGSHRTDRTDDDQATTNAANWKGARKCGGRDRASLGGELWKSCQ